MSGKAGGERELPSSPTELERARTQFVDDVRAGRHPDIEQYIQRLPNLEGELRAFALYVETIDAGLPDSDAVADPALSEAARAALEHIAQRNGVATGSQASAGSEPRPGRVAASGTSNLVSAGRAAGIAPDMLARRVGVSLDLLALLDRGAIDPATVPGVLITRLAALLGVSQQTVARYVQGPALRKVAEATAPYVIADHSTAGRMSFREAVRQSALSAEQKREWAAALDAECDEHDPG